MDTIVSVNGKTKRMFANILIVVVMLVIAQPLPGSVSAQETAVPEGWHDGVEGDVRAASCNASGWTVDPDDRDLQVRILADGNPIATTTANLLREDVGACTGGTCGFDVKLWGLISSDVEHQITAQAYDEETASWVDLSGTPKTVTCWGYPEGFQDGAEGIVDPNSCTAFGWAVDPDDRDRDVQVRILSDGNEVASIKAIDYGEDMDTLGICPGGTCRFTANLWAVITPYEEHQITVQAYDAETSTWFDLNNTPKSLTCRTHDIYLFDTRTKETRRLTTLDDSYEYNPRWSPDGKKIVHDTWSTDWSSHGIYITDVNTGVSTPLAGAERGSYPTWAPNGKWIVFDRGADNDYRLFIVSPTGSIPKLVRADAFMASWSPNSQYLAFHQQSDGSIRTIDLKGGLETVVVEHGNGPAWSSDGQWIAYEWNGDVWKVGVDSRGNPVGDPIQLTSSPAWEGRPTWSNNSKTIAFHAGMGQDTDIWTIPAAGGTASWLTGATVYGDYDPNYSFNGRYIAYSSLSPEGQAIRYWISAYTYDAGTWNLGDHSYHFEAVWNAGSEITPEVHFTVSDEAPQYDGHVLLRGATLRANIGGSCSIIDSFIRSDQQTRFHNGYQTDQPMTYEEAIEFFNSLSAHVVWDGGNWAELVRHEVIPYSVGDWPAYYCTYTQ